ncbi:hypothetical protein LPJ56_000621 [Coemansia sp. RSA 2599]|nr:hypothetical protein LPJ75_000237 [Coemansia sp. RSA 2598]KAJ1829112.1 hypothetical protein LPJ56_000621 [Coemansia sp. RSA 2599]
MALLAFSNLQVLRQDISMQTEELTRDIQLTESQMRLLSSSFDRYLQGLATYSADDARVMGILGERLAALETRLRSTREELVNAEQRFIGLLTTWATSRF